MEVNTELVCVVASIGYNDGDEYFKSVDCIESLKDIIRFLRHENLQICDIRRQLGYSKLLQNDLVPLIVSNPDDRGLSDIILRLLVNLTSAPHLCFEQNPMEEHANDSSERQAHELELMSYLQSYKEAFTQKSAMSAVSSHLAAILQKDVADRDEDDDLLLERILLLVRNLLYVPADPDEEKRTDDDVTVHDQLLWSLHENGIDDLLIYISSSEDERNWCMHACEIISLMFREQNAEELAKASEVRSINEKEEDTKSLKAILEREREEKGKILQNRGARHSRFGGSFWVKQHKALNEEQDLVYHRTLQSAKDMTYDFDKMPKRKSKARAAMTEVNLERKSTLSVRLFLKDFCIKFLHHGYNNLLYAVKSSIDSGKTQKNDESFYLAVMRFFMMFNRVYDFKVEYVSQTVGVQIFSYILKLILKYSDEYEIIKPTKEKGKKILSSRRIHLAVRAFKELLMYVAVMVKTNDENLAPVAEVIESNIFYDEEYRNVFVTLLRHWNCAFQTRDHLKDVIETFHLYLKLFESFLKEKDTFLTHTKKAKKKLKASKRRHLAGTKKVPIQITEEQAEKLWHSEVSTMLSARLQGREGGIPDDIVIPFDLNSDAPTDEQVLSALATVQRLLRFKQPGEAIAYLRASRECWPGENQFGRKNISAEEEFMCARTIFFKEMPNEILQIANDRLQIKETEAIQEELVEDEVDEPEISVQQGEKVFELKAFLKTLARHYVVEPYCFMLKTYEINRHHTNHCVLKMLNRIAVDLDMFPMLFQLSLFVTFRRILNERRADHNKELKGFARFILSKFFEIYKTNPKVIVELLFWKNNTDCYEITEGYGSLCSSRKEKTNSYSEIGKWTFEEEQEILDLYDAFKDEADALERITEQLSKKGRTLKQIRNKLVRLRVLEKPKKRKASEWTEEETEELRNLFNEFHASDDPLKGIMDAKTFNKSKKWVIARLLEIGLIEDKRELRAKRKKTKKDDAVGDDDDGLVIDENGESRFGEGIHSGDSSVSEEEDDNDDDDDDDDDVNYISSRTSSLPRILQQLMGQGFRNEIDWIKSRLSRLGSEREDMDEDHWHSVPLVPTTSEHDTALSSKVFKQMMKLVGISPPANEQESFWRFSSSLSPDEIKDFTSELEKALKLDSSFHRENEKNSNEISKTGNEMEQNLTEQPEESDDEIFERFIHGNKFTPANLDSGNDKGGRVNTEKPICEKNGENDNRQNENQCDLELENGHDSVVRGSFTDNASIDGEGSIGSSPLPLKTGKRSRRAAFEDKDDNEVESEHEGSVCQGDALEREGKRRKNSGVEDANQGDVEEPFKKAEEAEEQSEESNEMGMMKTRGGNVCEKAMNGGGKSVEDCTENEGNDNCHEDMMSGGEDEGRDDKSVDQCEEIEATIENNDDESFVLEMSDDD